MDRHLEERDEEIEKKYSSSLGDLLRFMLILEKKVLIITFVLTQRKQMMRLLPFYCLRRHIRV